MSSPINYNDPYLKNDGSIVPIGEGMGGTLTPATANKLGGIKVGSGLSITGDGTLSGANIPAHTVSDAGKVLTVADDGSLEWDVKGSGGGDYLLSYDYTKFGSRTIRGTVYSENGALLNANKSEIILPITFNNISLFVDVDTLKLTAGDNKRFIMGEYNQGLIYRNTGLWGFYGGTSAWEMTELSDGNLFDGSTVKVYIDGDNKWHIYKDGVLIFEPANALPITTLTIGSYDGYSIQGGIITGARIYNGNYTE